MNNKDPLLQLLSDFMNELEPFLDLFGKFNEQKDELQTAREFANRFFCNLVSLENHLLSKDSLSSALIQRYNHEMFLDFFYIFGSQLIKQRIAEFFSYEEKLIIQGNLQTWRDKSSLKKEELNKFVPPWIAGSKSLKRVYKKLSDMAHPNTISMRLNRRGTKFEHIIIKDSIALVIHEIISCFLYQPFYSLVLSGNFDMAVFHKKMREFQSKTYKLVASD